MKFKDHKISIVTVSSSPSKRQLINTHLRSKGYEEVSGAPDLKTVLELLDNQVIHWLICPLEANEQYNALQILQYVCEHPKAMDMRMSLLISQNEIKYLGKAFDLGLLSYHVGLEAKTDVEAGFDEFMNLIERYQGRQDLVAAHYLRQYLKKEGRNSELFEFEKRLLKLNPGQADLLVSVGESYFLQGDREHGEALFRQALLIKPELDQSLKAAAEKYNFDPCTNDSVENPWNILGVESCLVLDPSDDDRSKIVSFLKKMGVPEIKDFGKAAMGLKEVENGMKFDLIICEWSFSDMAGPILVQKLRDRLGFSVPLAAINQSLTSRDLPILREMGVTDRIGKPLEEQEFCKSVVWIINQDRQPTEPGMIYQKLIHAIKDRDKEKIASLKQKYFGHPSVGDQERLYIDGLVAYSSGLYLAAKESALNCIKAGGDSLDALSLLGKSMMKLREFDAALRCLENARVISPKNITRICEIAETHLEKGDDDKYEEAVAEAKDMDPDNIAVKSTEAKAALKKGDAKASKSIMSTLDSLEDIVSFTNNRAVSLIRTDSFNEGIRLYRDAMDSVPEDREKIRAIIAYNLSLAHIRAGKIDDAIQVIENSPYNDKDSLISKKLNNIRLRIKQSMKSGEEFKLQPIQIPDLGDEKERLEQLSKQADELLKNLKVNPGDIGCHKIYIERIHDDNVDKLLAKKINLKKGKQKKAS